MLQSCRQTPLLLSRPCAGLWLIANAFHWCLERHRNAPAHNYHIRERHERILTLFRASFFSFLAGAYLSLIDANSDPLLRTLLLLLLGQFVSSSETSHLSYSPGAEKKQAQKSPNPPGALLSDAFCDGRRRWGTTYLPESLLDVALRPGVEGWRSWCVWVNSDFSLSANRRFIPILCIRELFLCFSAAILIFCWLTLNYFYNDSQWILHQFIVWFLFTDLLTFCLPLFSQIMSNIFIKNIQFANIGN